MGKTFLALLAVLSLLLSAFAVAQPAAASHESDVDRGEYPLSNADRECQEEGFDFGFKLDDLDTAEEGVYTYSANGFSGSIRLIDSDDDGEVDDFEILSGPQPTIVKQPNEGGGISHITFCFAVAPEFTIEKTGDAVGKVGIEDVVTYSVTITNTGSGTIHLSELSDSLVDLSGVDTSACETLAPASDETDDDSCTFTYTYTIQNDTALNSDGDLDNEVSATYTSRAGGAGASTTLSDGHTVDIFTPEISVTKEITTDGPHVVGEPVGYKITITNETTGSANSPDLVIDTISDSLNDDVSAADCADLSLATGEFCEITYTLTFDEADEYCNIVSVETTPEGFPNDVDGTAEACVTVGDDEDLGSITIQKEFEGECPVCPTRTPGYWFNRGGGGGVDMANDLLPDLDVAFPIGEEGAVVEFGSVQAVHDYLDWDRSGGDGEMGLSGTGQLLRHYLALLLNVTVTDCPWDEIFFNGTSVMDWLLAAEQVLLAGGENEEIKDALDAINNADVDDGTLECPEGTAGGLAGFMFQLWFEGEPVGEPMTTGADGVVTFTGLTLGAEYQISETGGPANLECAIASAWLGDEELPVVNGFITVTIPADAEEANLTITVVNECEEIEDEDELGELEIIKIFCAFPGEDDILSLGPVFEEPIEGFGIASAHEDVLDDLLEDDCTLGAPAMDAAGATFTIVGETDDGDTVNLTETTTWRAILTLDLEPGDYRVTELGTELFADVRVEAEGDTVVIVFNYEEEVPVEEGQGRIKIIKLACTGPAGVTFTVVPGDQSSAQLPAGAANCRVSNATFVLENADGDQSEPFTVGSDGIRLVPVEVAGSPYTLIETDPLDGESGDIVVTEGATTTVIVFNLTAGEGQQPTEGGQPNEGTRGGNPTGEGTLPNTATAPELSGSVPAALLALVMLTGLGAAGYAMQAEARRRR